MNLETYFDEFCKVFEHNPPCANDYNDDPERLRWLVRYDARNFGAGLAGYADSDVEKLLHLTWNAYVKAFIRNSRAMKLMGDFSNKTFYKWIMEAKHDAEAAGWNCKRANEYAAQHNMQRTVGDSPAPQVLQQPENLPTAEAEASPAQLPLM